MRSAAARTGVIALLLTLCAVVLGACGGDDDGANASDGSNASDDSQEEAGLRFAECMREHGVDVPDPQPGGGIQLGGPSGSADVRPSDPAFQDAFEACEDELGDFGPAELSPEEREELEESALRFAQCMRDHGVDVPDPQFDSGPGGGLGILFGGADVDSPAFQEASEACQDELPQRPGAGTGDAG
jgi:hypothetical protein